MRILVVEDSAKMAGLLRKGLERDGHAVDVTGSGDEAAWMAVENDYDAIVLDIILDASRPGIDGFEVCRRARQAGCWTPVLMVTARDAVSDRVRGLDTGADDYLPKPFSLEEFLARVRALIRRGAAPRPAVLRVGDLALDPATHEVWRGNVPISLTSTEFALLEYFMRHPDEVLARLRLVGHVWDEAYDGDPRIVNVYVRTLREKIDRPFGRATLETIRGAGYRISDDAQDPDTD
ncbi:MAG TPA: response regulator transcription factor [Streptosporangiaceae bacterium]|jgi:two-component system OmpR family response regulator|nr:response regulator transcription factor [Streptosporangiaceae bacterium]